MYFAIWRCAKTISQHEKNTDVQYGNLKVAGLGSQGKQVTNQGNQVVAKFQKVIMSYTQLSTTVDALGCPHVPWHMLYHRVHKVENKPIGSDVVDNQIDANFSRVSSTWWTLQYIAKSGAIMCHGTCDIVSSFSSSGCVQSSTQNVVDKFQKVLMSYKQLSTIVEALGYPHVPWHMLYHRVHKFENIYSGI